VYLILTVSLEPGCDRVVVIPARILNAGYYGLRNSLAGCLSFHALANARKYAEQLAAEYAARTPEQAAAESLAVVVLDAEPGDCAPVSEYGDAAALAAFHAAEDKRGGDAYNPGEWVA
jgi:hypothetical protein